MKQILRSIIDFSDSITQENLVHNYQQLLSSRYEWDRPDDSKIYEFIREYFQARMELPAAGTIAHFYESTGETDIVERIKDIAATEPFIRSNFAYILKNAVEERMRHKAVQLLKESQEIVAKGLDIEGDRKFGVRDGLTHFSQRANDLIVPDYNARVAGDILLDGQEVWDEYQAAKINKDNVWGKFTGLNEIDKVCRGVKRGELWVHGASPGELKTAFAMNWAYNLVTRYRTNVIYWSLEMPYAQLRRIAYGGIHSANGRWAAEGRKKGLDYRSVRDGLLNDDDERFFQEVVKDFSTNPDYCSLEVRSPDREVTIDDIRLDSELVHKQKEVGLIVIDHGQLVEARKGKKSKDYVVELNSVVRDAKKLALHFNHGQGVPVLLLWQINRQGKDDADKDEGVYKMKAFTYANEVEKSADILTTTYLNDDYRTRGRTKICNLKNRDNQLFKPFEAAVDFPTRRIKNINPYAEATKGMSVEEHQSAVNELIGNL